MSVNVCIYGQIRYICLGMDYFLCRTTMAVKVGVSFEPDS